MQADRHKQAEREQTDELCVAPISPKLRTEDGLVTKQHRIEDSLVCCSPDKVTVHGAILQLTGGHSVQRTAESGAISRIGAVRFHTADGLTHKMTQGRLSPAAHCPIPVHHTFAAQQSSWLLCTT